MKLLLLLNISFFIHVQIQMNGLLIGFINDLLNEVNDLLINRLFFEFIKSNFRNFFGRC
jgi:hypothetical protein